MFDVLVTLIVDALRKITDTAVEGIAAKAKSKRGFAIALLALYDAIVDLQKQLSEAIATLQAYPSNETRYRRWTTRHALDKLGEAVVTFSKALFRTYSVIQIYNPQLLTKLEVDILHEKDVTIAIANTLVAASPRVKLDGFDETEELIIATSIPDATFKGIMDVTVAGDRIAQQLNELKQRLYAALNKQEVSYATAEAIAFILRRAEERVVQLEAARNDLAAFIRENVSLSEILSEV